MQDFIISAATRDPSLKRFFYCFKDYQEEGHSGKKLPFRYHPLSFAILRERGEESFVCRIKEEWDQAPESERQKYADNSPILSYDEIRSRLARFLSAVATKSSSGRFKTFIFVIIYQNYMGAWMVILVPILM